MAEEQKRHIVISILVGSTGCMIIKGVMTMKTVDKGNMDVMLIRYYYF